MKQEVLELILNAEHEYHNTLRHSVSEAERYIDERKKDQAVYLENLKYEWYLFEKNEKEALEKSLAEAETKMEAEAKIKKESLRSLQAEKLEEISERVAREVLGF